jgi:hypothetical protein
VQGILSVDCLVIVGQPGKSAKEDEELLNRAEAT